MIISTQLILALISFLIFAIYNIIAIIRFGVLTSLSNTYYLYNSIKKGLGVVFSITLSIVGGLLLPAWLDISDGSNFQFLAFLCCAMIIFVAYAPQFKDDKLTSTVHTASAILSAICGLLWIFIVTPFWYVPLIMGIIFVLIGFITKSLKRCYVYWLEMIAFISTYVTIILYDVIIKGIY